MTYTADSPIVGTGSVSAEAIDAFIAIVGQERAAKSAPDGVYVALPAGIGAVIIAAAQTWPVSVDHILVAAQFIHETGGGQSFWWRLHNNPAGIGVDGTPGTGEHFDTPREGFVAQVAHLLDYAVGRSIWTAFDRRAAAMPAASFGAAPTLHGLDGRWATPGIGYGASIAALANRLVDFANNGAWGPAVPTIDITGYVSPRIVSQPFAPNGVSYVGTDMEMWGVCIHETGNTSPSAEAQANRTYMASPACVSRQASWHATVGKDVVIEAIPANKQAYHASDGDGPGNTHFYAIEGVMCYPVDSPAFTRVMQNHAWYAAKLLVDHGLPCRIGEQDARYADGVTVAQHNAFSRDRKNCPQFYRDNGLWPTFGAYVHAFYDALAAMPTPEPPVPPDTTMVNGVPIVRGFRAHFLKLGAVVSPADPVRGGIAIFGKPLDAEYPTAFGSAQKFERYIMEWHRDNAGPFDIIGTIRGQPDPERSTP